MLRKIFYRLNTTVAGGAILIAFFSVMSKMLGLVRDRLLAGTYGADRALDMYFAAFKIPDFVFNILVVGALTSSFIPIFQKTWRKNRSEGITLANSVLNLFLVSIAIMITLIWLTAPWLIPLLVPGFSQSEIVQTISLTRILLVSLFFFTASNVLSGILNSWKKFFTFALSSVMYNLGIISGIILFNPTWGLEGIMYGAVIGSFLHFSVQLIEALRNGWRYNFILQWSTELRRIITLMIPRTIGLAAYQINIVLITSIASSLSPGSLAIFMFADNLQGFPISIFGISLAVAVFPSFTQFANDRDIQSFRTAFSIQFRRILYFLLPISLLIIVLRAQIVRIILGTGSFNWEDTILTANALGLFAISIFSQGLIPLVARAFYAHEDTKTPVLVSLITIAINVMLAFFLSSHYGVLGLALSFSISSIINLLLLIIILKIKLGDIDENTLLESTVRIAAGAVCASVVAYGSLRILSDIVNMRSFFGILMQGSIAGFLAGLFYLAFSAYFNFPEIEFAKRYLRRMTKIFKSHGSK